MDSEDEAAFQCLRRTYRSCNRIESDTSDSDVENNNIEAVSDTKHKKKNKPIKKIRNETKKLMDDSLDQAIKATSEIQLKEKKKYIEKLDDDAKKRLDYLLDQAEIFTHFLSNGNASKLNDQRRAKEG